jgi:hypothetical protein
MAMDILTFIVMFEHIKGECIQEINEIRLYKDFITAQILKVAKRNILLYQVMDIRKDGIKDDR